MFPALVLASPPSLPLSLIDAPEFEAFLDEGLGVDGSEAGQKSALAARGHASPVARSMLVAPSRERYLRNNSFFAKSYSC